MTLSNPNTYPPDVAKKAQDLSSKVLSLEGYFEVGEVSVTCDTCFSTETGNIVNLPNGIIPFDVVVRELGKLGWTFYQALNSKWVWRPLVGLPNGLGDLITAKSPFDIIAALQALIKAREFKNET